MTTEFGLSELYEVAIRATYPIEVGGKTIEPGEIIAAFDKIMIANVQEIKNSVNAHGGWDNRGFVFWDATKEVRINFTQGIFSKTQLALLSAARLVTNAEGEYKFIHHREELESDEEGLITLTHTAADPIFVYKTKDWQKINFEKVSDTVLRIDTPYTNVLVDYQYAYDNNFSTLIVGQPLTAGFLTLEGKTRVKDDITGQTHTGILFIPRLKLLSDLSMRLGQDATPLVSRLDAIALPVGDRRNTKVMELFFLSDDIDSDM